MKFRELIILLPCHSLEDFPQHHEGEDAEGLLANWTALWHPAFIAAAGAAPTWCRVDDPPADLEERLLLVPSVSIDQLATGFADRAKESGACLIRRLHDRDEILARAGEVFDGAPDDVDSRIVADFLALGYCFLQIQLLTRQMRYASNLDEVHFNDQLIAAAQAAVGGDQQLARDKLTACFDLLAEERDHYYAVDAFLIDLTLIAEQTLGAALRQELAGSTPVNLLMAAELAGQLVASESETCAALKQALADAKVGLIGGELHEGRLPLLSCESLLRELRRGQAAWQESFGRQIEVFGRRCFGLTPLLPQVLDRLGFRGALHATLDDGRFPLGSQTKTRWEGADGASIDAIAKPPLDASKAETFLNLARKLGESMDMDHVATLSFAHWPGHASIWYDDLRRCGEYGNALGKFVTVETYFRDSYMPGHQDRFEADQYRSPYLKQSIVRREADPISTLQRYWRRHTAASVARHLTALTSLVSGQQVAGLDDALLAEIDQSAEDPDRQGLDQRIDDGVSQATAAFAACLPRAETAQQPGYLVVNPFSFVRRVGIETPELKSLPTVERPIYAAAGSGASKRAVVDVPPMGFVWVTAGQPSRKQRTELLLAEDLRERDNTVVLRNEFLEASIDPVTGTLNSFKNYNSRNNRLSQQLALRRAGSRPGPGERWNEPDKNAVYSVMAADSVEIKAATSAFAEVLVQGRLLDQEGQLHARYRQTYSIWRGSRVLNLQIELEPEAEPAANPWNAYYACRFAWADEAAELFRGVNQTRCAATQKQIEAPLYVEISNGETRTSILTGGLPYHQQIGRRMLDSLLLVRGERQRTFQLGIGIDLPHPQNEALALLAPATMIYQTASPPHSGPSGWLFHIDARNVIATEWEPIAKEAGVVGFRARLLETCGRATRTKLSSFRPIRSAQPMDFLGSARGDCQLDEGRVQLELGASEWVEIEVFWA